MSEPGELIEKTVFIGIEKIQLVIAEGFCDVYDALSSDEQIEMNLLFLAASIAFPVLSSFTIPFKVPRPD